ncbi:MAG: YARHG domain-containing protein [Sulfurovum sp.]|nr:YARHG domain-containing protein [Sulfurovum sp.]
MKFIELYLKKLIYPFVVQYLRRNEISNSSKQRSLTLMPNYQNMSCADLWYARNKIFADSGYCFKGQRAISVFSRRCYPPYGRLSNKSKAEVGIIKYWEKRRGCR